MQIFKGMAFAVLLAAAGCAAPSHTTAETSQDAIVTPEPTPAPSDALAPPVEAGVRTVTVDQAGQTITVAVGERFAVALVGTPTAGYLWQMDATPAFLTATGDFSAPTTRAQSQPGFTGGRHWEVFNFTVNAAGDGALTLGQRRPWETDQPASQTFTVTIRAQ